MCQALGMGGDTDPPHLIHAVSLVLGTQWVLKEVYE